MVSTPDRNNPLNYRLEQEVDGPPEKDNDMDKMTLEELANNIALWGLTRKITINGNPHTQTLKLMSEMGELADNIAKGRYEVAKDDIGDCIVVLIMIAELIDTDIRECLQVAFDDIKDRKGYLNADGVFIKEGDVE